MGGGHPSLSLNYMDIEQLSVTFALLNIEICSAVHLHHIGKLHTQPCVITPNGTLLTCVFDWSLVAVVTHNCRNDVGSKVGRGSIMSSQVTMYSRMICIRKGKALEFIVYLNF